VSPTGWPEAIEVTLPDEGSVERVLPFGLGRTITGKVVAEANGEPVPGAIVDIGPVGDHTTTAAADGTFTLDDWMGGANGAIRCEAPGFASASVRPGDAHEVTISLRRGVRIRGRLVAMDGAALVGAHVAAVGTDDNESSARRASIARAVSDEQGRFELADLSGESAHRLVVAARGYGRMDRALAATGKDVDLGDLTLNAPRAIAGRLVAEDQLGDLTSESFFLHTLWHEMSHGLGPGKIDVDGRVTEVRLELKEHYSTLEEAKADAMGEWTILTMHAAGRDYFPAAIVRQQATTYLAGLFRSVRFGIGEAHGAANAIQFNYLVEKGVITQDPHDGRFRIDIARFPAAIEDLVRDICLLQAVGDYAGTGAFIARYSTMPPLLADALARLDGIPVDIEPVFTQYPD